MTTYESLKEESPIFIDDQSDLPDEIKGLYIETSMTKMIMLNKGISLETERRCILAEELGHYHTTYGNIIDQTDIRNRKYEKKARNWAFEKLITMDRIIEAFHKGIRNRFELAEFLDVTEEFLSEAIMHFQQKYGLYTTIGRYSIYFDPLGVLEWYEYS